MSSRHSVKTWIWVIEPWPASFSSMRASCIRLHFAISSCDSL